MLYLTNYTRKLQPVEDDDLKSIDEFTTETDEEIRELNERFMVDGKCCCPLCKALEKHGDCQ